MTRFSRLFWLSAPLSILAGFLIGGPLSKVASASVGPARNCVAKDLVELEVRDVVPIGPEQAHAVMLVSPEGTVLPVFVGEESAVAIAFRLAHRTPPHPLAADLTDHVLSQLGGKVEEVRIDSIHEHIFEGRVFLRQGSRRFAIQARPSDAIAMALTGGAKIYATRDVISQGGITREEIDHERQQGSGLAEPGSIPPPALDGGITL